MGFSRHEYRSELPFHSPGDLPDPGIKPSSLALQVDSLPSEPPGKPQVLDSCCRGSQHLKRIWRSSGQHPSSYLSLEAGRGQAPGPSAITGEDSQFSSFLRLISKLPVKLARTWANRSIGPPAPTWTFSRRESGMGGAAGSFM
ncbi:unnamed protein product [Rangifer tarandus platyrhynchus]|uniref:Uncharacterized protein n=1 Tax=Rangifer tarandus platyrhynchus TaxID=3082113 RepID=A0AC59Z2W5_RANTA